MVNSRGDSVSWRATRIWAEKQLATGERLVDAVRLRGGWSSDMRRLYVEGPGGPRSLVLRSFTKPFYLPHAQALLTREADILGLLGGTGVPVARPVALDATAAHCDHPSLLMTLLPGSIRLADDTEADARADLLARQLAAIHRTPVTDATRPRAYQPWASPDRVTVPARTTRPELWARSIDALRRQPPAHRGRFLHRDFHPGNVLFTGTGPDLRISGVVDWVETSWGPTDLDVAHCSTALALLHGADAGMRFADRYTAAGGTLTESPSDHLHWRLLDALGFAPDAEKVAVPWREVGRGDLTPELLTRRLEDYLQSLWDRY
ncbi:phosphotransferase family protein [Streptomyces sp. NPDC051561]|uniref:phosphotransferase family protein n=1 Tax=Streptomyces sp. NPDC051561 TaxID=3365658 RepID=UPI003798D5C7